MSEMAEVDLGTPLHGGPPSLADFVTGYQGRGVVVDEGLARDSPCLCRELEAGGDICFSHGVVGPLDSEQRELFCSAGTDRLEVTPEQAARLNLFAETAQACGQEAGSAPEGERLEPYLSCLEREMRAREARA